jgi:ribosomal protein L24
MAQTYQVNDKVVITQGPDTGRTATVLANFRAVYGDDLTDGALVAFDDGKPSNDPVPGQIGVKREFVSSKLRCA